MKNFIKLIILSISITIFCNILIVHMLPELFYSYDSKAYDNAVRDKIETDGEDEKIEEIVIIDIDNISTDPKNLGKFYKWPYDYHAKLIEQISKDKPKIIAFDMIFPPDPDSKRNDIFSNASKASGNVIGALSFVNSDPDKFLRADKTPPAGYNYKRDSYNITSNQIANRREYDIMDAPFPQFFNANKANGMVVFEPDNDGIIRRVKPTLEYFGQQYPFLGMQMFIQTNDVKNLDFSDPDTLKFLNSNNEAIRNIPLDKTGQMRISYFGGINKFRVLPYVWVLERDRFGLEPGFFKDKYVLIGSSLTGLYDLRSTPVSKIYPGVGIHANVLKTILDENYTERLTELELTALLFLAIFFTCIFVFYLRIIVASSVIIITNVLIYIIALVVYENYYFWIQVVPLIFSIIFTMIFMYAYKYATEEKNKKMIRSAFSQFVTKAVVDELLSDPSKLKLGGERKNCSVFFSDVAGFTTISEQLEPEELVTLLNLYLTRMTNVIFDNKGMIDKYIGDAIMAVYGAPVSTGNHAYQACKAAIEQQEKITELQGDLKRQNLPYIMARMGINSGDMVVGNMGSDDYFNYTVMGDTVNLAARLEPANKQYDTLIMIGENTYQMAKEFIYTRPLDLMVVKGKTEPVKVHELVGLKEKPLSNMEEQVLDLYTSAYKLYLNREWDNALDLLNQALRLKPEDGPTKVYIGRCEEYKKNEPDENWSGVFVMTSK